MDCDTLLTVGSNFPYTQFMPPLEQARAIQIDIDGAFIGMRYPYELNLVGRRSERRSRRSCRCSNASRIVRGGRRSRRTCQVGGRPSSARR